MATDLKISQLTRSFGDVVALRDASLEIERGEIVSVLGPSGCGKSTLLQLIAGHLTPDSGSIEIAGVTVADANSHGFVPPQQRSVGMVFQDYALFPHLTVAKNISYALRTGGVLRRRAKRHAADARVRELLIQFQLDGLAERLPSELSGGQQQRVAIARALAQQPQLLLLDEPFCNLDVSTREHVRSEIVDMLRSTGLTCIFVTHDQEEALAISDRVAVMQGGHVMQVDDPETLYQRPFCKEVAEFLGRTNIIAGTAQHGFVETELGSFPLTQAATGEVRVLIRPELIDVRVPKGPDAPRRTATVIAREFRGHDVVYKLKLASGHTAWAHRPSIDMAPIGSTVALHPLPGFASVVQADTDEAQHVHSTIPDLVDEASPTRSR